MRDSSFTARIEPAGWHFDAPSTMPLLQAALRAGIQLPSSCRNGTCRPGRCRLLGGRVDYRIEWPGLLAQEKQEGFILPCVAHAADDLVIDAPAATRIPA